MRRRLHVIVAEILNGTTGVKQQAIDLLLFCLPYG